MKKIAHPLLLTLLTITTNATALSLQPEARPDGTTALLLTTGPAPERPLHLNEDPAVRSALVDFLGYTTGSYTNDNTLIVQQVLEALDSEYSIYTEGVPAGRKVIAAMDDGNNGRERAALMLDDQGQIRAVGLVNGHCTIKSREEPVTCNELPNTVLTIFQAKNEKAADAAPLIGWSKELPPMLAIRAESDDPETRASAQKIAKVEYVVTEPQNKGWTPEQLPSVFPKAMLAMLPQRAYLIGAGADGVFTTPGMEGSPIDGDWDAIAGRPTHDFELILRTLTDYYNVIEFYKHQAKGAQISGDDSKALIEGVMDGGTYTIEIKNKEEEGTVITLSAWRKEV